MSAICKEQVAADIIRNLSEALANICRARVGEFSPTGSRIMTGIEKKLMKWIDKL